MCRKRETNGPGHTTRMKCCCCCCCGADGGQSLPVRTGSVITRITHQPNGNLGKHYAAELNPSNSCRGKQSADNLKWASCRGLASGWTTDGDARLICKDQTKHLISVELCYLLHLRSRLHISWVASCDAWCTAAFYNTLVYFITSERSEKKSINTVYYLDILPAHVSCISLHMQ